MNRRAAASVRSIKDGLLSDPPAGLLLFLIFGSQVRNTQSPDSDLDILCITRTGSKKFYESLCSVLAGTRGGQGGIVYSTRGSHFGMLAVLPPSWHQYKMTSGSIQSGLSRTWQIHSIQIEHFLITTSH